MTDRRRLSACCETLRTVTGHAASAGPWSRRRRPGRAYPNGMGLPPGPRLPPAVQLLEQMVRPLAFFDRCIQRRDRRFTSRLAGLADPAALHAGKANRILEPLVGAGSPLLLDGDEHLRQRLPGARTDPYAWFPLGGGIRRCVGMAFALYEMTIVLATVMARARLRLAEPVRVVRRSLTLAPSGGTRVVLEERRRRGSGGWPRAEVA
jgi:hypothetical protein